MVNKAEIAMIGDMIGEDLNIFEIHQIEQDREIFKYNKIEDIIKNHESFKDLIMEIEYEIREYILQNYIKDTVKEKCIIEMVGAHINENQCNDYNFYELDKEIKKCFLLAFGDEISDDKILAEYRANCLSYIYHGEY